ncbi:DNA helicase [Tanacetum coccineum]
MMTRIRYTTQSGDGLCGGRLFDVMPFRECILTGDGNELARAGVQNVNVGTGGRAPLSIEACEMTGTTNVAVSKVFDRFRNMRLNSFCSDYVNQSVPIIHHISVSTVDERGCVHTSPLITSSLEETSYSRAICSPGVAGYVGSSSRIAPVNHAYLCLNVTDGIVRPEIVPFTRTRPTTYEGDDHRQNTYHTCGLFQHSEVFPTTAMSDMAYLGTRSMTQSSIKARTPSYIDLGDCDQQCQHWKIYMPPTPDPPVFIRQLLTNSHFMEHIRAYNQMFAMTSFGAKVDNSVNNGNVPYVFKAEVSNRMRNFGFQEEDTLNPDIVEGLIHVLDEHNGLVRLFRTARDRCNAGEIPAFKIRLYNTGGALGYELPDSDVLGGIVFEDGPKSRTYFDVIIEFRGGLPQRINKLHQSYMSLQFSLLFVFDEPGYYPELLLKPENSRGRGQKVTINAYYKYQLHSRVKGFGLIFKGGRLFQQYVVAAFCAIEQSRLDFIRKRQCELRSDYLLGLYDAISQGDREGIQVGSMVMLPRTFTGGPRYMYSHYLDALAICRSLGNPQFFITFTCNVKWPEIKRYMLQFPGLTPADRADIVCRIFQQKVNDFLGFLKDERPFGYVIACTVKSILYTTEFQKRGLPHYHTLLWVDSSNKIKDATQIDDYIFAELPDPVEDPIVYKVVTELMMHGPCGVANPSAVCTEKGICNKGFPKMYNDKTFFNINGHTHYRRRQTEVHFMKGESRLDNCNVVPYNRMPCLAFRAHINVEYCGWSMLIKYLFKYISKGPDRILGKIDRQVGNSSSSTVEKHIQVDEIKNYVDGRFICPFEACWRIFDYPIHRREPAVQILNMHLEIMQRVNFRERDRLDVIVNMPDKKKTTLTEWYVYNNEHTDGRHLTYLDFPSKFVWYADSKSWHKRVIQTKKSIGRLTYVHPNFGDLFYFRMLLSHKKGCRSPIEVRTVNGQALPTYRAACEALGLLGDDKEWDIALEESGVSATSAQLRTLFAQILVYCGVADPRKLWEKHWEAMKLEVTLNGFGKSVKEFGLPTPPEHLLKDLKNKLLMKEKNYRRDVLLQESALSVPTLNEEQKQIYSLIMNASEQSRQEMLFVYGHGGTSKMFLWKTIISSLWSQGKIVLAAASSGIASLLLPAGRTAHSRFKLPLELTDESICHAKKHSQLGNLLIETDLIIWDEAPMNDKCCFEALDRTLRDLMNAPETVFGGKTVVLGGDFRQTLPVKKNMRLLRSDLSGEERQCSKLFVEWLLDALSQLIDFIYNDATLKTPTANAFQEKAIVCPKNDAADAVNAKILASVQGVTKTYLCRDEAIQMGRETSETEMLYPIEYLNTITFPGFSPRELQLKIILNNGWNNSYIFESWERRLRHRSKSVSKMNFQKYSKNERNSILLHSNRQRGNQLPSRVPYKDEETSKMVYPILSDYLGCIRSISDLTPSGDANTRQKYRRKWKRSPVAYQDTEVEDVRFTCDAMITSFDERRSWAIRHVANARNSPQKETASTPVRTMENKSHQHTVADGTVTAEFTFFTEAGEKIIGHSYSDVMHKFETTDKTKLPVELVNTIGKNHIFQIQFSLNTQRGAGRFITNDVLDIQPTNDQRNAGLMTHASINKDKGADTQLATSTILTIQDSTSQDSNMPGM